jgi:hypothetical protein
LPHSSRSQLSFSLGRELVRDAEIVDIKELEAWNYYRRNSITKRRRRFWPLCFSVDVDGGSSREGVNIIIRG